MRNSSAGNDFHGSPLKSSRASAQSTREAPSLSGKTSSKHSQSQQTLPAKDVKKDLLALGIDLDESLIERMERNLGISVSLGAMSRASAVVRERAPQCDEGFAPEIQLRCDESHKKSPEKVIPSQVRCSWIYMMIFKLRRVIFCIYRWIHIAHR